MWKKTDIFKKEGGSSILYNYGDSHIKAISSVLGISEKGFSTKAKCNIHQRKNFFYEFAEELGLKSYEEWYQIQYSHVKEKKGGSAILYYYKGISY